MGQTRNIQKKTTELLRQRKQIKAVLEDQQTCENYTNYATANFDIMIHNNSKLQAKYLTIAREEIAKGQIGEELPFMRIADKIKGLLESQQEKLTEVMAKNYYYLGFMQDEIQIHMQGIQYNIWQINFDEIAKHLITKIEEGVR